MRASFLAALPFLVGGCAGEAVHEPPCFLGADHAAGLAASSSTEGSGIVLDATYVAAGCIIVPEEEDYALSAGAASAGTLAFGEDQAVLTISALRVSRTFQRRATIVARFDLPLVAGARAVSAEVVRRRADTSAGDPVVVTTTSVEATVTLTALDPSTGQVAGDFSSGFLTGGGTLASFYGRFDARVEVAGAP